MLLIHVLVELFGSTVLYAHDLIVLWLWTHRYTIRFNDFSLTKLNMLFYWHKFIFFNVIDRIYTLHQHWLFELFTYLFLLVIDALLQRLHNQVEADGFKLQNQLEGWRQLLEDAGIKINRTQTEFRRLAFHIANVKMLLLSRDKNLLIFIYTLLASRSKHRPDKVFKINIYATVCMICMRLYLLYYITLR